MGKSAADKLQDYMVVIEEELLNSVNSPLVQTQLADTIGKLWEKDDGRAYLAIRGYLRYPVVKSTGSVEDNWVYSEEQAQRYQRSKYFQQTVQPILNKINAEFKKRNGAFGRDKEYGVSTQMKPRSLKEQLNNWLASFDPKRDRGRSDKHGIMLVFNASEDLKRKLLAEIARSTYDDDPGVGSGLADFKKFLTGSRTDPPQALTFATPGLSDHGTGRAFDFVVPGAVGTEATAASLSAWRDKKWDKQLNEAIRAVDPRETIFKGPLGTRSLPGPDEPWHYFYVPVPPRESHG